MKRTFLEKRVISIVLLCILMVINVLPVFITGSVLIISCLSYFFIFIILRNLYREINEKL
jgi:hypothetical protein